MSKKNLFVSVFLFLVLSLQSLDIFSEENVVIKMTDWNLLKTELKKLEESNKQKQKLLIDLQESSKKNMEELENLKNLNQQTKKQLENCESSLEKSNQKIIYSKIKIGITCFSLGFTAGVITSFLLKK